MKQQITQARRNEIIPVEELPKTKPQVVSLLKTSPMLYWDSIKPVRIEDVFNSPMLSLVEIKKESNENFLRALMVKWLNGFLRFYSTNGTMDEMQVADTINLILEEYPHYSQEDLKLFFNMAKKGRFGQIYGRIDGEVIMRWLKEYNHMRCTEAEKASINEKTVLNSDKYYLSTPECIDSYKEYKRLQELAKNGDAEALKALGKYGIVENERIKHMGIYTTNRK